MKKFLKVLAGFAIVLLLLFAGAKISGNGYLVKGLWASYLHGNNSATIDDARFFDTHEIKATSEVDEWHLHNNYNKTPLSKTLTDMLTTTKSVAFLVMRSLLEFVERISQTQSGLSEIGYRLGRSGNRARFQPARS